MWDGEKAWAAYERSERRKHAVHAKQSEIAMARAKAAGRSRPTHEDQMAAQAATRDEYERASRWW